jgi:WXG100 family type VII secretion target
MGVLRVNFVELDRAAKHYQDTVANTLQALKRLESQVEPLMALWLTDSSGSRPTYDGAKAEWNAAAQKLADTGVAFADAVHASNRGMQEAEATNVAHISRSTRGMI